MSKFIRWKNGQVINADILTENDQINHDNTINTIHNIQKYNYGIGFIKINEITLIHGILCIESCSITFSNGNTAKNHNNINEFQFQKVFHGQEIPIFLRCINDTNDEKYISDQVIIDTQGDIYLGKIQNINGIYQLSLDGCYLNIKSHNQFINFIGQCIQELTGIYKYYQNNLLNIDTKEYLTTLLNVKDIKILINIVNNIQDNIYHPFDAYNLLCPYMFKYMKYDHNNNIRCLKNIVDNIMQCHKILEESNVVEMDDHYYYINMKNKNEIRIIINPRDDIINSWMENTYICSKDKIKSLNKQIHKGLAREISRYGEYLMVTIYRNNEYIDASNIICIARDENVKILNMKVLN